MIKRTGFPRILLFIALLTGLAGGFLTPGLVNEDVSAAPLGASALDVVISEVAWGGTTANTVDEWIELYNTTNAPIDLTGWTLIANDGDPNISLAGTIPANGYFLLESGDDFTISNIQADQVYSGSLGNGGEVLTLRDNLLNSVDVANSNGGAWDAGSGSPNFWSMARTIPAAVVDTWSNGTSVTIGLDANGNSLKGTPHNSKVDLELSMTVDNPAPTVGANIEFTIVITNNGNYDATNVSVKDVFPTSGILYVSDDSGGTYVGNIWTIGTLSTSTSKTLKIVATVTAEGVKTNRAEVWTVDQFDPDSTPGNGITTEDDFALAQASTPLATSLNITNTVNNSTPNVGSNVVFSIVVSNPSGNPYTAHNVQVAALLPTGLTYVSNFPTQGTYDSNSGVWMIGTMAVNSSATISITAKVITSAPLPYSATVSSDEYLDNTATRTLNDPLPGEANLTLSHGAVTLTNTAAQVILPVTIKNNGPDVVTNVEVKDLLPSGLDYVSYNATAGSYSSSTGIWSINSLANAETATLNITVKVAESGTSTKNFAEVWSSDQFDPDSIPGNGENGEDDNVSKEVPIVDLSLTENVDISGNIAIFTINVTNSGPDDATGVKVKTSLPSLTSAYTFVSYGSTQGIYDSSLGNATSGIWDVGSLAEGETETLIITTNIVGSLMANWVEVFASGQVDFDSVPNNNSKTEDDDASAPRADLKLTKTVNNSTPKVDSNVVFTITVVNDGPARATNVQIKDILPSGLIYQSSSAPSGTSYSNTTGIWNVGILESGKSKNLNITAKVTNSGTITNWAEVWKIAEEDSDSKPGNGSTNEDDDDSAVIKVPLPPPAASRAVIINEVAWAGTASSLYNDEWIELYNPGSKSINITGWILKTASGSVNITLSGNIPANGYFLLEREDNDTVSNIPANQIYYGTLSNYNERLFLYDTSNKVIDTANGSGSYYWPAGSSSTYGSMERDGTGPESASSWHTNIGVTKNGKNANGENILGTPGKKNSPKPPQTPTRTPTNIRTATPVRTPTASIDPRLLINEVLARPGFDWNRDGHADVYDEFIEIKNVTPVDVSLSGWKIDNGIIKVEDGRKVYTLPGTIILKPGERIAIYSADSNFLLSDAGAYIRLLNPKNVVYDEFQYDLARTEDRSFCRIPDGGYSVQAWYDDCTPTPKLTNTREGSAPSMIGDYQSLVCSLPDSIPVDFFIAECHGRGANIWNDFFWDEFGWFDELMIPDQTSKWDSFIK